VTVGQTKQTSNQSTNQCETTNNPNKQKSKKPNNQSNNQSKQQPPTNYQDGPLGSSSMNLPSIHFSRTSKASLFLPIPHNKHW